MEDNRITKEGAVHKIIGNVPPERRSSDSQYIQHAFSQTQNHPESWNVQSKMQQHNQYMPPYGVINQEVPMAYGGCDQQFSQQVPFSYMQNHQIYNTDLLDKHVEDERNRNYEMYTGVTGGNIRDLGIFSHDYKLFMSHLNDGYVQINQENVVLNGNVLKNTSLGNSNLNSNTISSNTSGSTLCDSISLSTNHNLNGNVVNTLKMGSHTLNGRNILNGSNILNEKNILKESSILKGNNVLNPNNIMSAGDILNASNVLSTSNLLNTSNVLNTSNALNTNNILNANSVLNGTTLNTSNTVNGNISVANRTPLIENLVGNWVPNTSGTYSPFGNVTPFKNNLFDNTNIEARQTGEDSQTIKQEIKDRTNEDITFSFARDNKKPRMVAEVKPMRPSYSDVLLKSAPQTNNTKSNKMEVKETKAKKESKKNIKNESKEKKTILNRSSTSNEIKDIPFERINQNGKSTEKVGKEKGHNLNRKWASLDNVSEKFEAKEYLPEKKGKKNEESSSRNNTAKMNHRRLNKSTNEGDVETGNGKNDSVNITKNVPKKPMKIGGKPRNYESCGSGSERPPGRRVQRSRKKENHVPLGFIGQKLKHYLRGWWKIFLRFILWLLHLISDICSLSIHISRDVAHNFWSSFLIYWHHFINNSMTLAKRIRVLTWLWEKIKKKPPEEEHKSFLNLGLQNNINMPTTGEEAMKRLLACKGKDPYSILGVTPVCTDDDIKRYYKRQAFLVHPDKNQQPGAEEAFKILVHAFDMIGEPDRRAAYDRGVAESVQVEQAWSELSDLLAQLQQKMEAAANTIRCSACGLHHKRIKIDRPSYAARNCTTCKIHHSAREGDIWAEARCFGFLWHYYACMEGGVYDITEWAGCQKDSLKHLKPDSHHVQYRIALGKQNGPSKRNSSTMRAERPPDLENLLNSLYGQDGMQNARRRNKKSAK